MKAILMVKGFCTLVAMLFLLSACRASETPNVDLGRTPSPSTPVESATLRPTQVRISGTASPSPTFISTVDVSTPTPTPIPTLSEDEAWALAVSMVENNGGCRLPCAWGVTPGVSSISDFETSIRRFDRIRDMERGGLVIGYILDDIRMYFFLSVYGEQEIVNLTISESGLLVEDGHRLAVGAFGDSATEPIMGYYTLPEILRGYGVPSSVLTYAWYDDRRPALEAVWTISIVVNYSEQGFLIEYLSRSQVTSDQVMGCPSNADTFHVSAWPPEQALSIEEAVAHLGGIGINDLNAWGFNSIEEVTSLTLEEFYQVFSEPNNTNCLEMPIEYWIQR